MLKAASQFDGNNQFNEADKLDNEVSGDVIDPQSIIDSQPELETDSTEKSSEDYPIDVYSIPSRRLGELESMFEKNEDRRDLYRSLGVGDVNNALLSIQSDPEFKELKPYEQQYLLSYEKANQFVKNLEDTPEGKWLLHSVANNWQVTQGSFDYSNERGNGILPIDGLNGHTNPKEIIASAYATFRVNPKWLRDHYPELYEITKKVSSEIRSQQI